MDTSDCSTLMDWLRTLPDPRCRRGRRYDWRFLLTLLVVAVVNEQTHLRAMSDWLEFHAAELLTWLGCPEGRMPSLSTLQRSLAALDFGGLRSRLAGHARELLAEWQGGEAAPLRGWAMDGKEARGARQHGEAVRVVNLMDHDSGFVMDQLVVPEETNEIPVGTALVSGQALHGVVVTADAAHTQRALVRTVLAQGGHYLLAAKANQPTLCAAIEELFAAPATRRWQPVEDCHESFDYGHGRCETRVLETSTLLCEWLDWEGVGQVFRRTCTREDARTHERTTEVHYGLTSLSSADASAADVERLCRGHWRIENQLHWVKDVLLGEDACTVGARRGAAALVALRNAVVTLFRSRLEGSLARTRRFYQSSVELSLALIGAG